MSSRRLTAIAVTLAATFALAACGDKGDDSASDVETVVVTETPGAGDTASPTDASTSPTITDSTSAPTESMTITPTGKIDEKELAEDLQGAVDVTLDWWTRHWKDYFTGKYSPPNVYGLYDGNDVANAPKCFGDPLPAGNAFYCPEGDYVAWDKTLIDLGYQIGDSWPYLIVAHEWGHSIQARLQMSLQDEKYELQADCLAGAVLYGAANDHPPTLFFARGDEKEIVDGLNFIADEVPWGMTGDHGDSFQRIEWFDKGRTRGVPGCLPGQTG